MSVKTENSHRCWEDGHQRARKVECIQATPLVARSGGNRNCGIGLGASKKSATACLDGQKLLSPTSTTTLRSSNPSVWLPPPLVPWPKARRSSLSWAPPNWVCPNRCYKPGCLFKHLPEGSNVPEKTRASEQWEKWQVFYCLLIPSDA